MMSKRNALILPLILACFATPAHAGLWDTMTGWLSGGSTTSTTTAAAPVSNGALIQVKAATAPGQVPCTGAGSVQESVNNAFAQRVQADAPKTTPSQAVDAYGVNDTLNKDMTGAYKYLQGFSLSGMFSGLMNQLTGTALSSVINKGQSYFAGQVNSIVASAGGKSTNSYGQIITSTVTNQVSSTANSAITGTANQIGNSANQSINSAVTNLLR